MKIHARYVLAILGKSIYQQSLLGHGRGTALFPTCVKFAIINILELDVLLLGSLTIMADGSCARAFSHHKRWRWVRALLFIPQ
jgi:hypothetical protein